MQIMITHLCSPGMSASLDADGGGEGRTLDGCASSVFHTCTSSCQLVCSCLSPPHCPQIQQVEHKSTLPLLLFLLLLLKLCLLWNSLVAVTLLTQMMIWDKPNLNPPSLPPATCLLPLLADVNVLCVSPYDAVKAGYQVSNEEMSAGQEH